MINTEHRQNNQNKKQKNVIKSRVDMLTLSGEKRRDYEILLNACDRLHYLLQLSIYPYINDLYQICNLEFHLLTRWNLGYQN